jgi:nicotinamidase-related amidase
MRTALLVIDMQQGSLAGPRPPHDVHGVVNRINSLAARVRASGGVVVYVQHDGPPGDPFHPDAPGWPLLAGLTPASDDTFTRKTACDAFLDTNLDDVLKQNGVERVIVTGWATDFCVDTTVRSTLARGYQTIVPADGHTTTDRPHLLAPKIIEHHNFVWSDFISPGGAATVMPCASIEMTR